MENNCILCQHSFNGIEAEKVRDILCQHCVEGSNFEAISGDQFGELLDITENQRKVIEREFDDYRNRQVGKTHF